MDGQAATVMAEGAVRTGARQRVPKDYQEAFVEAYRSYYARVFAYIYSRIDNVEMAKDLVAEVFEKAYVKGRSLRKPDAYATWLFMIAKNEMIGHYHRHKREINGISKMKESLWLSESPSDPEDGVLRSEAVSRLMRLLKRLSERDQELLSLKFDGELSYSEIGCVLKMSTVNVRVSIFRALRRLRSLMEEEEEHLDALARPAGRNAGCTGRQTAERLP